MIKKFFNNQKLINFCLSTIYILYIVIIIVMIGIEKNNETSTKEISSISGKDMIQYGKRNFKIEIQKESFTEINNSEIQDENNIEKINNEDVEKEDIQNTDVDIQTVDNETKENQETIEEQSIEKEQNIVDLDIEPTEIETASVEQSYQGFETVGKIEIPSTNVNIPILNKVTVKGMENAPCLLYSTGELNKSGDNLIVGHNYRNGTIFSDNENLQIDDKIYITSLDGNKVEYTIYDKFITTPEEIDYLKRETGEKPEITLSCCTDDDENRIIILARG